MACILPHFLDHHYKDRVKYKATESQIGVLSVQIILPKQH